VGRVIGFNNGGTLSGNYAFDGMSNNSSTAFSGATTGDGIDGASKTAAELQAAAAFPAPLTTSPPWTYAPGSLPILEGFTSGQNSDMPAHLTVPAPTTYAVTFPATLPTGIASITANDANPVASGGSFSFTLVYADGYGQTPATVTVNGVVLAPTTGNTYTITNITEAQTVVVGNAIPDPIIPPYNPPTPPPYIPTGIEDAPDSGIMVYTQPGAIVITVTTDRGERLSPSTTRATVYTLTGALHTQRTLSEGTTTLYLPKGIYVVVIDDKPYKVIVN
jgi:hypothetical protein